jgi:TetR/AcrR family transcriptional repressor of nem operon
MARANVRQQLVDAAKTNFHERGFNGTGVQDVVSSAGVPKGSFYNHFESKEALGAEIVELYFDERNKRSVLKDTSIHPSERLTIYFRAMNDRVEARNFVAGCLVGNFSAELADQSSIIRERLSTIWAQWTAEIAAVIDEVYVSQGRSSAPASSTIAYFLLSAWEGSVLRSKVDKSSRPLDVFMEMMAAILAR